MSAKTERPAKPAEPDVQTFEDGDLREFRRLLTYDIQRGLSRCSLDLASVDEYLRSGRTLDELEVVETDLGPDTVDPLMDTIVHLNMLDSSLWTMWRLLEEMRARKKKDPSPLRF